MSSGSSKQCVRVTSQNFICKINNFFPLPNNLAQDVHLLVGLS